MSELFDPVLARGRVREATSDRAWLQAMLDAEAALAGALADEGLVGRGRADAIAGACDAGRFDAAALGAAATGAGNPVVPLVRALTDAVGGEFGSGAAGDVHRGATSQDISDTAAMLVAHRALTPLRDDVRAAADAATELARHHAGTPIAGRTMSQHALPTTFGLKSAGWANALDAAAARLAAVALPVQLGGAAGTLASLGTAGPRALAALAARLGLAEPVLPWHTDRGPVAELAGALGHVAVATGKIAGDVVLLAQTEIAEVRSSGSAGVSSTMPHKRNPVDAIAARAGALQAPGLVATLLSAGMLHEHERAAGPWHAEWRPLSDLLRTVGSSASWLRSCLDGLQVDAGAMRANLDRTGGLLVSERVTTALADSMGRLAAHDVVTAAAGRSIDEGRPLADVLDDDPAVDLPRAELDVLLDPTVGLETAHTLVQRALTARRGAHG
ncbi:MAG: 3-carboxy-cis,cis-muconate cycloisomerase [Pseudonocardiaceae bacterium]|nr:3-carboxy-cis,cis-muconate cycloisomerase [Pseudonocardiaceae bacterium]